jgi:predicted PhzF superfamily epimerase YddE/YHI9
MVPLRSSQIDWAILPLKLCGLSGSAVYRPKVSRMGKTGQSNNPLATAHVIFNHTAYNKNEIIFQSGSGQLMVTKSNDMLFMDFPARPPETVKAPEALVRGLGKEPLEVGKARDYLALYPSEEDILSIKPDFAALAEVDCLGIIITAEGSQSDFVSRFFAPRAGVNEDPVTGSAHTTLIPFWAKKLKKKSLHAFQVSERKGELFCEDKDDRVKIGGRAKTYLKEPILKAKSSYNAVRLLPP